jgi:glutamyl-tRNA reductase
MELVPMKLVLNNITYHDCPVQERERVTFTPEQRHFMLRRMHASEAISEAAILQTCNRLEFYLYAKKNFDCRGFLIGLIRHLQPNAVDTWKKYGKESSGIDMVRHLFEVSAGLDSQMLGENQILSQVKAAYTESINCRMSRLIFHRLFHIAFRAGKAVRTHTDINCGAVSIGLAAVELAKSKIDVPAAAAMIIGAGENSELVVRYLLKAGLKHLIIANRDTEKAEDIASRLETGRVIALSEITETLPGIDLLISSTASVEPIIEYRMVKDMLAGRAKSLLIIDIAVPRDVEPKVGKFECVSLYNIDDLNEQINANREKRSSEIPKAQQIVEEFTSKFESWLSSLDLVPVISKLTQKGLELARSEAARYAKDFGEDNSEKLKSFAESLVRKVLHGPISFIKADGGEDLSTEQLQSVDLINKMFLSEQQGGE